MPRCREIGQNDSGVAHPAGAALKDEQMSSMIRPGSGPIGLRDLLRTTLLGLAVSGCSLGASEPSATNEASVHVAEAALNAGSPRVALQVAQTILSHSPDNVPALLVRGDALTQLAQNDDAGAAFQQALRRDPASLHAKVGLGRIRLTTDPTEAAGLFRDVLRAEPTNMSALTDLGIALDLLGQHQEAQAFYHRALQDNPTNVPVQVNLALSLARGGDTSRALGLIEPLARERNAAVKVRHNYAAILTMAGRRGDAATVLKADLSQEQTNQALTAYRRGTDVATGAPPPQVEQAPVTVAAVGLAETPAAKAEPAVPAVRAQTVPVIPVPVAATPISAHVVVSESTPTETIVVTRTSAPLSTVPLASAPRVAAPTATVPPVIAPLAAMPRVRPSVESPAPDAPAPVSTTTSDSRPSMTFETAEIEIGPHVQLGAFGSESAARREWRRLNHKLPDLMASREPSITTVERDGTTFWRLRTWGFSDESAARSFCSHVRTASRRCMVYSA